MLHHVNGVKIAESHDVLGSSRGVVRCKSTAPFGAHSSPRALRFRKRCQLGTSEPRYVAALVTWASQEAHHQPGVCFCVVV